MRVIAWCVVLGMLLLLVGGCGSGGSGLNGSLSMSVSSAALPGTGLYQISATSTYTNPTQTNLIGTPITFHIDLHSADSSSSYTQTVNTNNSGSVTLNFNVPQSWASPAVVTVWTSTGSLQGFDKQITLPQIAALSLTPSFFNISSASFPTAQTAGIVGGVGGFRAYSSTLSKYATINISGAVVTFTQYTSSGGASGSFKIVDGVRPGPALTVPVSLRH